MRNGYAPVVSESPANRNLRPSLGSMTNTGRQNSQPPAEEIPTQRKNYTSKNPNERPSGGAAKSVYTTGGRGYSKSPDQKFRTRTKSEANNLGASGNSYGEDFPHKGINGSFSDKQTTYDNVSRMTKGKTGQKRAKTSARRQPLPKVADIVAKSEVKGKIAKPLDINDAEKFFDDPQEREAIKKAVQGIFKINKSHDLEIRKFGITFQDWDYCTKNPIVAARLNQEDQGENDDKNSAKKKKSKEPKKPKVTFDGDDKVPWWDMFIIGHRNTLYMIFNILMCVICIISSYFYASLIGFRYTFEDSERQKLLNTMIVYESFFFLHFVLQFFLEYKNEGYPPERDIAAIAKNYIFNGTFTIDLVCLLPLSLSQMKRRRELLFLIVKMLRLVKGFKLFDVQVLMHYIKMIQYERTQQIVDYDPVTANDTIIDHNNVEKLLMTSYTL